MNTTKMVLNISRRYYDDLYQRIDRYHIGGISTTRYWYLYFNLCIALCTVCNFDPFMRLDDVFGPTHVPHRQNLGTKESNLTRYPYLLSVSSYVHLMNE